VDKIWKPVASRPERCIGKPQPHRLRARL
jgi:hypothetical protein